MTRALTRRCYSALLNELATVGTLGIYSPVDIKVTCAS